LLGTLPIARGTGASAAARRPLGYMESAQKYLAEHPISRVFSWRHWRYGVLSATPATHSSSADKSLRSNLTLYRHKSRLTL